LHLYGCCHLKLNCVASPLVRYFQMAATLGDLAGLPLLMNAPCPHCEQISTLCTVQRQRLGTGETMRRREFIALTGASVTWPFAAVAQQAGRAYHLGVLTTDPHTAPIQGGTYIALLDGLKRQGFVEGKNLTVDNRVYGQHPELLPNYLDELIKAKVDVIFVAGPSRIRAAQQATKTIPILAITDDMVGSGLVGSLAHPNGNTTGVSVFAPELNGKRLEILIEAVPGLRRMAALADVYATSDDRGLEEVARARNVALSIYRVAKGDEIVTAIDTAHASGATALNVLASPLFYRNRQIIMEREAALRLPTMYQWPEAAEQGGFAAYGPRLLPLFGEVLARQLVQLLRGTKVADIPVEQPTKFELVINLKTANAMAVAVPSALLVRADKVIE
jgi:putative tryptophan/tyrosine transport system substrate-binding protein